MILLRALNRRSSHEKSAEEFYECEFFREGRPDVRLSVYELEDSCDLITQTFAEHWVSTKSPTPHDPCAGFDATGSTGTIEPTLGNGKFAFTINAHREICFMRDEDVRALADAVYQNWATCSRSVSRVSLKVYMKSQLSASNEEWLRACPETSKWKDWIMRGK